MILKAKNYCITSKHLRVTDICVPKYETDICVAKYEANISEIHPRYAQGEEGPTTSVSLK